MTTASWFSSEKSSKASNTSANSSIRSGESSFQRFLRVFSSYSVGATKKNLQVSHKSLIKLTRSFIKPTTVTTLSIGASMPCSFKIGMKSPATSSLLFFNIYSWLNHFPFSKSNFAPALLQRCRSKSFTSSSKDISSWSLPGFHPNRARKLITASGR